MPPFARRRWRGGARLRLLRLVLELVPIFRITHGCHPGEGGASKRTGSTENFRRIAPTRPAGAVRVNVRSEAFHRNTRSASAADAKTFGSAGVRRDGVQIQHVPVHLHADGRNVLAVLVLHLPDVARVRAKHEFARVFPCPWS